MVDAQNMNINPKEVIESKIARSRLCCSLGCSIASYLPWQVQSESSTRILTLRTFRG